jgi:hypothetical protein
MALHDSGSGLGAELSDRSQRGAQQAVEYSVMAKRTPIGEWKEVLYRLTYRTEWMAERNCWRDIVVKQERCEEC